MSTLNFIRIESPIEKDFSCGNVSIDQMMQDSFPLDKLRRFYTFQIMYKDTIIGYYMLGLKRFHIDELKEPLDEYYIAPYDDMYAMHIQYIAIKTDYQCRQIGSKTLQYIIETASMLSSEVPFRIVTLDALESLVNWYKTFGFKSIDQNLQNPETVLMYRDMLSNDEIAHLDDLTELGCSRIT